MMDRPIANAEKPPAPTTVRPNEGGVVTMQDLPDAVREPRGVPELDGDPDMV